LDLEEEFHSMAKGLDPVLPFDYTFILNKENKTDDDEFGVWFTINQENGFDMKVQLLEDHKAVFFTKHSEKPQMIFWDLKEKKQIGSMISFELKKPLHCIMSSKKPSNEKFRVFILDEGMNVYCGSLSKDEGFVLNQTIIIPEEEEFEVEIQEKNNQVEVIKELEAKFNLCLGKKTRMKNSRDFYPTHYVDAPSKDVDGLDQNFEDKTKRSFHEIFGKEEWLIVHQANRFHFVNLDEGNIHEFSSDVEDIGSLATKNWTIYKDTLLITSPFNVFHYKINFEDKAIRFMFSRGISELGVEKVVKQWIVLDPCFTVLVFAYGNNDLGSAMRATIVVTSTQEFLDERCKYTDMIFYKIQAERLIPIPGRWENKSRDLDIKFENSKVFVSTKKAGFFFDMNLSSQPYSSKSLNGWVPKHPITTIQFTKACVKVEEAELVTEEEQVEKIVRAKCVNNMKLKVNPNTVNAKEKNNGWNKNGNGKSQAKKEEHREERVVKGKGDKYHKNVRQGQRSDKMS